jgi:hypothetical protein
VLAGEREADPLVDFAFVAAGRSAAAIDAHVRGLRSPGRQQFLETWLALVGHAALLPEGTANRQALIESERHRSSRELQGRGGAERLRALFRQLETWKTPIQYEAAILLVVEEHDRAPTAVVQALHGALAHGVPRAEPPPYDRAHTNLHVLSLLARSVGDPALAPRFAELARSPSAYVRGEAAAALPWVQRGTRYPIRYHELKRVFRSRS